MADYYEFAELSFDKDTSAAKKGGCDFVLLTGDNSVNEKHYVESWVDILPALGRQGWFVGGVMDYNTLRSILLQRKVVI